MKCATLLMMATLMLFPALSHALCVSGDRVKLRTKPDPKAKVGWVVGRNMPLLEVARKGAWIQVQDLERKNFWIHARSVTDRVNCVVVRSTRVNLRSGPGLQFGQTDLGVVKKYTTFKKIGRDEEWIKVQDSFGMVHWVNESAMWEPRNYSRITF